MPCSSSCYPPSPYDEDFHSDYDMALELLKNAMRELESLKKQFEWLPERIAKQEEVVETLKKTMSLMGNGG